MPDYPTPPFLSQRQTIPGLTNNMQTYKGSGRLEGKKAVITGGDSGIGRAVVIAYARECADVLIAYRDEDIRETKRLAEEAGRKAVLVAGDIQSSEHCHLTIDRSVSELDGIDILVNIAAHQKTFENIEDIADEEWGSHSGSTFTSMSS